MEIKTIEKSDVSNKTVILRVDFNCPIKGGKVLDSYRIKRSLDTVQYLFNNGVKKIIILTHLGRPDGKFQSDSSLLPVVSDFAEKMADFGLGDLNIKLIKYKKDIKNCTEEAKKTKSRITFLENIRFWREETENDKKFAKKLASLGDIFVNDAFSVCHRVHASIFGIAHYLPSYGGLLLAKEIEEIEKNVEKPISPAIAIIGGAKLETKMPVIQSLAKKYDKILVGGLIAVEFIKKFGKEKKIPNFPHSEKIILPVGFKGDKKQDIDEESAENFAGLLASAKTILWNGPLGKFEDKPYRKGSLIVAKAVAKSTAYKLVGGGETHEMLQLFGIFDKIDFVSTGGGAMLEFIGKKNLPGIEILKK
jgi:phosphoglycerate kinase